MSQPEVFIFVFPFVRLSLSTIAPAGHVLFRIGREILEKSFHLLRVREFVFFYFCQSKERFVIFMFGTSLFVVSEVFNPIRTSFVYVCLFWAWSVQAWAKFSVVGRLGQLFNL